MGPRHRPPGRATQWTPTRPSSPSGTTRPPQQGPSEPPTPDRTPQPPASHTRPALRTTTRARLTSTDQPRQNTRQHGIQHRSGPQCNAPRQGTPKHNTPQHDATRRGTERHTTARQGATRRGPAGRAATHPGPTGRSTAKHGTTQHGGPQHTTTPKQGTLTEGLTKSSHRTPRKEPHQPATHRQGATARPETRVAVDPNKPLPEI